MRIEFLKANEDSTWSTEIVTVPDTVERSTNALVEWANATLGVQAQYRDIVLWAVYSIEPEDERPFCEECDIIDPRHPWDHYDWCSHYRAEAVQS